MDRTWHIRVRGTWDDNGVTRTRGYRSEDMTREEAAVAIETLLYEQDGDWAAIVDATGREEVVCERLPELICSWPNLERREERHHYSVFWALQDFRTEDRYLSPEEAAALFVVDPLILTMGRVLDEDPYIIVEHERGELIEKAMHLAESAKQLKRRARAYGYTITDSGAITAPSRAVEQAAITAYLAGAEHDQSHPSPEATTPQPDHGTG